MPSNSGGPPYALNWSAKCPVCGQFVCAEDGSLLRPRSIVPPHFVEVSREGKEPCKGGKGGHVVI